MKEGKHYSIERAEEEALELTKKVEGGTAKNYDQAERQVEREQVFGERLDEGFIEKKVRKVKEKFVDPEVYIGPRDMLIFSKAHYGKEELAWIAEVKKASNNREYPGVNAYDLIRVHAMLARDIYEFGPGMISDRTEAYLDEILMVILKRYDYIIDLIAEHGLDWVRSRITSTYELQAVTLIQKHKRLKTAQDKAALLTEWLTIIHHGGNREVLSAIGGYPRSQSRGGWKKHMEEQADFLSKLNNLGTKRSGED